MHKYNKAQLGTSFLILYLGRSLTGTNLLKINIPNNSTIIVLKHFYVDFYISTVYWLYKIVPNLNNSRLERSAASLDLRPLKPKNSSTNILRYWF